MRFALLCLLCLSISAAPNDAPTNKPARKPVAANVVSNLGGTDFAGRPFITQRAPELKFERRKAPHPGGINYPFPEQTARGVALFARFPAFNLSDRRIHLSGPWYDSSAANLQFSRGMTSVEAMPNFRLDGAKFSIRDIPHTHKWQLLGDSLFWNAAKKLADEFQAANANDERIAPLRLLADEHKMSPHEAAYLALGREIWNGERFAVDAAGKGVLYPCIDIELTGGFEFQHPCQGWLFRGMAEAAREEGVEIIPETYGVWTFEVGAVQTSMRQNDTGEPEYLKPEKDYLPAPDPLLQIVEEQSGAIAMDGYMQAIWGNEPFYQRDPNGALVLQNGAPIWNDITQTTAYGQTIPLEPNEAEHCLSDLYRQATRMVLMHVRIAGEYPERSDMRKPFLKNSRISAWTRITNEGLLGIEHNDRPLPFWMLETLTQMYLFSADDLVVWSSDTNVPAPALGADNSKYWSYNAHGTLEAIVKGAHRYSALDQLHRDTAPFTWCWFHLPTIDKNESDGERPYQKPIVWAKIRSFEQQPWLELFATFPALDNQATDMKIWVDKNGQRSPAYTIHLQNGRSNFYDAWQLPPQFKDIDSKDVWLRFTDAAGQVRTWRGDWRAPVDENVTTPEDFR